MVWRGSAAKRPWARLTKLAIHPRGELGSLLTHTHWVALLAKMGYCQRVLAADNIGQL